MKCRGCGADLAPEARFCAGCGLPRTGAKRGGLPWWAWLLILGGGALLLIPCLGIIAAIAIPSLLRARIAANEAAAIADVRTMEVAQATFAAASGGALATPECLLNPASCLPAGATVSGPLLAAERLPGTRQGYRFEFHPGPSAGTGLAAYAYTAEPLVPNSTGRRAFCVDSSRGVCWVVRPAESTTWRLDAACPRDCQPL